jgi:uncharacterized membrane protein YqjE
MIRPGKIRDAASFVQEQADTYLQLAQLQWQESCQILLRQALWALVLVLAGTLACAFAGIALLALVWETRWRLGGLIGLPVLLALLALAAWRRVRRCAPAAGWLRLREEIGQDISVIREALWRKP